jgi:hypothetical protein
LLNHCPIDFHFIATESEGGLAGAHFLACTCAVKISAELWESHRLVNKGVDSLMIFQNFLFVYSRHALSARYGVVTHQLGNFLPLTCED